MGILQFVACKFRSGDSRAYTYQWDGEPLAPGDKVKVPDKSGDGWKAVIVESVSWANPPFPCKPILGKVDEPAEPNQGLPFPEAGDANPSR